MKSIYVNFSICLLTVLTSCGHKQEEKASDLASQSVKVETSSVQVSDHLTKLRYSGTIEPSQTIALSFQATGTVEKVLVNAGDAVRKGQLLATLDRSNMKSMYEITKAKYQQAKDAYNRLKTVHEQGSLPDIKWVEMETNLEEAKSSLELSRNNLSKCNLYAPVNGVIGHRNIEPGMSSISLTSSPLDLVNINTVYVKIPVPENEIGKIKKGLTASFVVSALSNKEFTGKITNISPVADPISRTYDVKILVTNSRQELKPGMVCDVNLNGSIRKKIISVPYSAVTKDNNGKTFVYTVSSDKKHAIKQNVTVGNYLDNEIEILSGLTPNQEIVVEGKEKLSNQSLISL